MKRLTIITASLTLTVALAAIPALRAGVVQVPVPVIVSQTPPHWTPVPGVPGVHYAPNLQYDVFRFGGGYYCQYKGEWLRAGALQGPWTVVQEPPRLFRRIESPYFKVPPGWAKGKKAGWHGAPTGQMKKYRNGSGHIPPGQAKKMAPLPY